MVTAQVKSILELPFTIEVFNRKIPLFISKATLNIGRYLLCVIYGTLHVWLRHLETKKVGEAVFRKL
jgi:hypothetical protein